MGYPHQDFAPTKTSFPFPPDPLVSENDFHCPRSLKKLTSIQHTMKQNAFWLSSMYLRMYNLVILSIVFFAPLLTFTKINRKFSCWRYWFVSFWLSITSFHRFLVGKILTKDKLLFCVKNMEKKTKWTSYLWIHHNFTG